MNEYHVTVSYVLKGHQMFVIMNYKFHVFEKRGGNTCVFT